MSDDLAVLDPASTAVDYVGERLEIKPLTIGQLPKLVRLARPLIDGLMDSDFDKLTDGAEIGPLLDLLDQHSEGVFDAAALVTGRDREWIESGNPAEFVQLVRTVIEVNRDFFTRKLAPLLAARAKPSNGDGQTASNSSSSAATH